MTDLSLFAPEARYGGIATTPADAVRLLTAMQRVFISMSGGGWYTTQALRMIGGLSGDRRARELREPANGGLTVERENLGGGEYRFRLVATPAQLLEAAKLLRIPKSHMPFAGDDE